MRHRIKECARCGEDIVRKHEYGEDGKGIWDDEKFRYKFHWVHPPRSRNGEPWLPESDTCGGERIKVKMPKRTGKDPQQGKVYRWEDSGVIPNFRACNSGRIGHRKGEVCKRPPMTKPEMEAFAARVARDYGIRTPRIVLTHGGGRASVWRNEIRLGVTCRSKGVMLHELAHLLAHDGHGPRFMRVFIDLLARYLKLSARELRASARKAHLKVAKKSQVAQPKTKRSPRGVRTRASQAAVRQG